MTQETTIQEFLKPRYKLMADYPGNSRPIGFVFTMDKKDSEGWYTTTGYLQETFFKMYPHLFKLLSWWEERAPEEMPEYVKWDYKPRVDNSEMEGLVRKVIGWTQAGYGVQTTENSITGTKHWLPATEAEYNAYINSTSRIGG